MKERGMLPVSWCVLQTHYFTTYMAGLMILQFCDFHGVWTLPLTVVWLIANIWKAFTPGSQRIWCSVGLVLVCCGWSRGLPVLLHLLMLRDNGQMKRFLKPVVNLGADKLEEILEEISVPVVKPVLGVNSMLVEGGLSEAFEHMTQFLTTVTNNFFKGFDTEAVYLRKIGISEAPIALEGKPAIEAKSVEEKYRRILDTTRMAVTLLCIYGALSLFGGLGAGFLGVAVSVLYSEEDQYVDVVNPKNKGVPIKDGIYRITNTLMNVPVTKGIGVCISGVLHVPYHVCRGASITVGKVRMYPYLVNVREDLVTYGGLPHITRPEAEDEVYVNCETDEGRTSYKVEIDYDDITSNLVWQSVTNPGESGSPLLARRNDKWVLLGLAGKYVSTGQEGKVEYSLVTPRKEETSRIVKILSHPGSGKTRKIIPRLAAEGTASGRVLILGPTRVVCRELYESLKRTLRCGLNIKGDHRRDHTAKVQIAAHRTGLAMLCKGSREVAGVKTVIIDEAHFDDPATKMLRMMLESPEYNCKVYLLSATLDGQISKGSNFDIKDVKINYGEIPKLVKDLLEEGKRILVFVKGGNDRLVKTIMAMNKSAKPIILSRNTFKEAMASVKDIDRRLILSTNIAECGVNIPDLDVVIDTCERFTYVMEGGIVEGRVMDTTEAEYVQRRGRVGREKSGTYYYTKDVTNTRHHGPKLASQFDAEVLATGRKWWTGSNDWNIKLEDAQFMRWLELDICPLWTWIAYNTEGVRRNQVNTASKILEVRSDGVEYIGCGEKNCGCEGSWKMYDERMHDKLFGKTEKDDILIPI